MLKRSLLLGIVLGLAWVPAAGSQPAKEPPPKEAAELVSLDVTDAYLEDVLKILSRQSKFNFVASEATRDLTVTLYLKDVPVDSAIQTLLRANNLALRPTAQENLFVVVESGRPPVETITKVFRLKYARVLPSAGEIFPIFGLTGSLIQQVFQGTGSGSTGGTGGTGVAGGVGGGVGGGIGGGVGGGIGGGLTSAGGTGQGQGGIVNIVRQLITEHGSVVPDPRTNSLIVTDVPERMTDIARTIAQLDIRPKQIYIEAEVLEVSLDTLRRLGFEYGLSSGQIASFDGPIRSTFFPFTQSLFSEAARSATAGTIDFSSVDLLLKLLATDTDTRFLARPRLMTLSNEVAEIRIIEEPVTGTIQSSQSVTGVIIEEPERTTVGTILRVTPLVNDEDYITMIIEPEVSRVAVSSFNSSFQDPLRRAARTSVMVEDGRTVMIAGLIEGKHSKASRRIPGLGDIPILGVPFKRTETDREDTEILLFITPHILGSEEKALVALDREQSGLSDAEQRRLSQHRRRIMKRRAMTETIENLTR